ncbi:MAG: hypothetical protein DDG60_00015 [Anaerolineae bacterium]|nr:MAG: hypothetical protein DDG60_00015 [Anaerolineae bacterium]
MKRIPFVFILAVLLLAACAAAPQTAPIPDVYGGAAPMAYEQKAYEVSNTSVNGVAVQERKVIENAELAIVVADPKARSAEIAQLARELGGFVVSSKIYERTMPSGASVPEANITIRVPAASLDEALARIKADVVEVRWENRSGQDVTNEYVDLQSRLKARQAAEAQLLKMMEQAQNAEDALAIFNQLIEIQSEIEVLKGQIKYYDESIATSAITVQLIAEESIQPIQIGGWRPQGEVRDALQALVRFLQGFVNFIIWLVIFIIPAGAVIITMLALLWRLLRWFWRKVFPKKVPAPAVKAAEE